MNKQNEQECCPKFDPTPWDNKDHAWQNKLFIKKSIPQFLHMPWPSTIGKTITYLWDMANKAEANLETKDFLLLAYDPSPWKSEFFMAVSKEVPGVENVQLSGNFVSKVFDGPYNDVPKWIKQMDKILADQSKQAKKYYFYYTTCPKCAKKYGHNYVVAFAEV